MTDNLSSANGDLQWVNVTAGVGGRSYLSFEAHYRLVTIHPWVDGNGRMARLVMNHIQFEFGMIPSKVLKEDKGDYINALITTREADDMSVFLDFMTGEKIKTLSSDIDAFLRSMDDGGEKTRPIGEIKQNSGPCSRSFWSRSTKSTGRIMSGLKGGSGSFDQGWLYFPGNSYLRKNQLFLSCVNS